LRILKLAAGGQMPLGRSNLWGSQMSESSVKIKIVAIAKDEGAYLAEWVYHHLHFGFHAIEVLINRTSDNSIRVIEQIRTKYSNVSYSILDWVDLCPVSTQRNIQYVAYALSLQNARTEGYSHVLFLDIDELWTPADFETSISSYLSRFPDKASISFNWFCELGSNTPFGRIDYNVTGFINEHIKTLISTYSQVTQIKIHSPIFGKGSTHLLASGDPFIPRDSNGQFHHIKPSDLASAFIIHRMFRSEVEYLACLFRGNPNERESVASRYKDNRHGFKTSSPQSRVFKIQPDIYQKYLSSFNDFVFNCSLRDEIITAESYVIKRAEHAIACASELSAQDPTVANKIFSGCLDPRLTNILSSPVNSFVYRIDSIKNEGEYYTILGWAFDRIARTPLAFVADDQFVITSFEVIPRPDVCKIYKQAHLDCGFKILLKPVDLSAKTVTPSCLTATTAPCLISFHGTQLFYSISDNRLKHLSRDIINPSEFLPVFISKHNGAYYPSVSTNSGLKGINITRPHCAQLCGISSPSTETLTAEEIDPKTICIKSFNNYASALANGIVAYDRENIRDWESFRVLDDTYITKYVLDLIAE
jgi:hypothetical protein